LIHITVIVSKGGVWYKACEYQAETVPRMGTEIKVKNTNLPTLTVSRIQHVVSDIGLEEVRVFGAAYLINLHLEGLSEISDFEPPNVFEEVINPGSEAAQAEQEILNEMGDD
jgi:hypothetical protein